MSAALEATGVARLRAQLVEADSGTTFTEEQAVLSVASVSIVYVAAGPTLVAYASDFITGLAAGGVVITALTTDRASVRFRCALGGGGVYPAFCLVPTHQMMPRPRTNYCSCGLDVLGLCRGRCS